MQRFMGRNGSQASIISVNKQPELQHAFNWTGNNSPSAAAGFVSANLAIYVPLFLHNDFKVNKLGWWNGVSMAGNIDIGIFDGITKAKLISTGATANNGVNGEQFVDVTDTWIPRGIHWVGLSASSTSQTFHGVPACDILLMFHTGIRQEASAHPLPATATFATSGFTVTNVPWMFVMDSGEKP